MVNQVKKPKSTQPFKYTTPSVGIVLIVFGLFFYGPLVVIGIIIGTVGLIQQAKNNHTTVIVLRILGAVVVLAMIAAIITVSVKDVKKYK